MCSLSVSLLSNVTLSNKVDVTLRYVTLLYFTLLYFTSNTNSLETSCQDKTF